MPLLPPFPRLRLLSTILLAGAGNLAIAATPTPAGAQATMALLETTDLHANVLSYDYYKLKPEPALGLERTATLIRQARAQYPNNLLLELAARLRPTHRA